MNAFEMMKKISETLENGEKITVHVAHKGAWSGAHIYEITNKGFKCIDHVWHSFGNVRDVYRTRVLKKGEPKIIELK